MQFLDLREIFCHGSVILITCYVNSAVLLHQLSCDYGQYITSLVKFELSFSLFVLYLLFILYSFILYYIYYIHFVSFCLPNTVNKDVHVTHSTNIGT